MPCSSRNGFIKTSIRWPDVRARRAAEETMRVLCPAPARFFPLLPAQCLCSMWFGIVVFLLPHLSMSTNSLAFLCSVISCMKPFPRPPHSPECVAVLGGAVICLFIRCRAPLASLLLCSECRLVVFCSPAR